MWGDCAVTEIRWGRGYQGSPKVLTQVQMSPGSAALWRHLVVVVFPPSYVAALWDQVKGIPGLSPG